MGQQRRLAGDEAKRNGLAPVTRQRSNLKWEEEEPKIMIFEWRDKKPYLVFYDYLSDLPKRTATGFLVSWAERPLPEASQPVVKTAIDGVYQVGNVRFNVQNPTAFYEETDVPRPTRIRSDLRWRYGWQKMTRRGWEPA